ncbi:MAG: hypothetical protein Q9168_005545 [Polycauliona sp. 1 TL-2023]
MAGIIAVYSLVIAVLIASAMSPEKKYSLFNGFLHLAAGLSVGLTGLAAGYTIGIVGDTGPLLILELFSAAEETLKPLDTTQPNHYRPLSTPPPPPTDLGMHHH